MNKIESNTLMQTLKTANYNPEIIDLYIQLF